MAAYNIAEAKAHFSEIVERAAAGEDVSIMRRGKPLVRMTADTRTRLPIDWEAIRRLRESLPPTDESSVEEMRKLARY